MTIKKYLFTILLFSIFFAYVSSNEFNYNEFKVKPFPKKIKYIIVSFFMSLEKCTYKLLFYLRLRNFSDPYDFFIFFIAGAIFRLLIVILKKLYKSMFNIKDSYVYNQPDNTENLYIINKKLDELSKNINNNLNINNEDENNINNNGNEKDKLSENDLLKLKQINEKNKTVNNKLAQIENYMKDIEDNYNKEKNNNEKILKTIEEAQTFIKDSLVGKSKEEE